MDNNLLLTSAQNPKVKAVIDLKNRKSRDEKGLFLIEGTRELERAVKGGVRLESVFICPELLKGREELLEELYKQQPLFFACSRPVFEKMTYREKPEGILAVAIQMRTTLESFRLSAHPFVVVAQAIEKPGNLGTILRSSDGAGSDGVIICDRCTDIYNPNVVRASVGTLFTQQVVEQSSAAVFEWLKKHRFKILAATPSARSLFTQVDLTGPIAIVVGAEETGLSKFWMDRADLQVAIPMKGVADSLNVATATTLLLYETLRQRGVQR